MLQRPCRRHCVGSDRYLTENGAHGGSSMEPWWMAGLAKGRDSKQGSSWLEET